MKTKLLTLCLATCFCTVYGQEEPDFSKHIQELKVEGQQLKDSVSNLYQQHSALLEDNAKLQNTQQRLSQRLIRLSAEVSKYKKEMKPVIGSIQESAQSNATSIQNAKAEIAQTVEKNKQDTSEHFMLVEQAISANRLYWIIAILCTLGILGLVFWLLGKRIKEHKNDFESNLDATRKSLEEEAVKLDKKLIELLEGQMKVAEIAASNNKDEDHSLALKVADEIIRINKNLSRMDKGTKGLKQLSASLNRIQDNFAANGYEIVDMLGKPYNDGMKVTANFVLDENIVGDERIITRIIKPQVNYNGIMIQSAQIEVSQGE